MVLERYTDQIIDYATNPVTGIQRVSKFPPSIAEVVSHCNAEVERLAKIKRYQDMGGIHREPREPQHRANVFMPASAIRYNEMVERAKAASENDWRWDADRPGIWIPMGWLDGGAVASFRRVGERTPAEPWLEEAANGPRL